MNIEVVNECTYLSDEEKISFPEVVKRLLQVNIESYYADLLSLKKTYYTNNTAYSVDCTLLSKKEVADTFNAQEVSDAIKQIQTGKIQYQAFLRKIMDAGVIAYFVFLKGKKAVYIGRRGEEHVEHFPQ